MGSHSNVTGGSGANRYINCIGSTALIEMAPPRETSDAAYLGTMLHFLMEEALGADEIIDPLSFVGDTIKLDEYDKDGEQIQFEVTEEHIVTKVLPALEWFDLTLNPEQFWLEQEVHFSGELEGAFGTADVLFIDGDRAGIVDWKFGDNVIVQAEGNDQLKFYLAAALHLQWFYDLTKHINEFEGYIVQPIEGETEYVSKAVFTRAELTQFNIALADALRKKDAGDKTLTLGDWCKFCPAEVICPAWRDRGKAAIEQLQEAHVPRETTKTGKPKAPSVKGTTAHVLDDYSHEGLAEFYLEVRQIAAWCEAVKAYVKGEFDKNQPIDGLKRVVYQNERQWVDEKQAIAWCRRQGLKAADYNQPAQLLSVAKIEDLVGKGNIKEDLVRTAPKGFSIVGMDDPRPAIDNTEDTHSLSQQLAKSLGKEK